MNIKQIEKILKEKSLLKNYAEKFKITNGGDVYSIWKRGYRYGEAKMSGNELVLYADRFWKDDIIQIEVQRIIM